MTNTIETSSPRVPSESKLLFPLDVLTTLTFELDVNGLILYSLICICYFLLNILFLKLIHDVACSSHLFIFIAVYSIPE